MRLRALALGFAIVLLTLVPAFGQDRAGGDGESSRIERRLEEIRPAERPEREPPAPKTRPESEAAPLGEFVLSAVIVEGSTVFEPADFAPLYEDLVATRVGPADLNRLTAAITRKYREAGYVLSRAVVPPQRVASGVLRLRVVEGYVDGVTVVGARHRAADLADYFDPVVAERPLELATIERALLLVDDLPGVRVADSALQPTGKPGGFHLRLQVERTDVEGVAYLDNRGTPESGPLESWTSLAANSALGLGEQLRLGLFTVPDDPRELVYVEARYLQPLGRDGTTLRVTAAHADLDSGGDLAASDTESGSRRVELQLSHPVLRTRAESLWVNGAFEWFDEEEDRFGRTSYEDRLRVARVGATWWLPRLWDGTLYVDGTASRGLDVFGASESGRAELSRFDGEARFTKAELEVRRVQQVNERVSLLLQAKGQLSADPLLASEEFALGGSAYGRGYDFGEVSGEDGAAGLVEVRLDGTPEPAWLERWQLYGFYDLGAVWNDNVAGKYERVSLASAGVGLRLTLTGGIFAGLEVAKPLTYTPDAEGDRHPRGFFTLSMQF